MNVPKLRFKEFSGEWEEKTFRDIVSLNLVPVEKPNTDYVRLGIRSHCKGTFHELVKIEDLLEADKMFLVPKDNLILNITFAWEHAIAITDENDEGKYVSGRFPTFAFKKNEVPTFYESIIRSKRMKYELGVASPGGAGRNRVLNKELFLDIPVKTTGFEEQTRIAEFVKCIDKKIENQKLVAESLENQKKGLMQKIFSQELRFKDDDGKEFPKWEEKKLGEVGCFTKGGNLSKADLSDYGTECILYGELYTRYSEIANNILSKTSVDKNTLYMSKYNDVLLPSSGETPEDISTATCLLKNGVALGGDLIVYRSDELDGRFNSYLLNHKCKMDIARIAQGKSVVHISSNALKKIVVPVPCLEEQKKIVGFLFAINEKIENAKKSLEHWQQIKKGLLQQMFV